MEFPKRKRLIESVYVFKNFFARKRKTAGFWPAVSPANAGENHCETTIYCGIINKYALNIKCRKSFEKN